MDNKERLKKSIAFKKRKYGSDVIARQKRKIKYFDNWGINTDFELQVLKVLEDTNNG